MRLARRVRNGQADLALLTLPVDDPALTSVPVLREELMLVMPAGHPLANKDSVGVEALVGQPFIIFEQGSNTRRTLDEFFVREQIKPRIVTETENVEIIKSMVAAGLGVAIVPLPVGRARDARRLAEGGAHPRAAAGARDRLGLPRRRARAARRPGNDGDADPHRAAAADQRRQGVVAS